MANVCAVFKKGDRSLPSNYRPFIPSTLRDWNSLAMDVRNSESVSSFKCSLNRDKPTKEPLFYIGDRRLQVLHTRLRTNCSSLNHHLHAKNIVESPCCTCGEIETTKHYFFDCPNFVNFRQALLDTLEGLCNPTVEVILHGDKGLSQEVNEIIFHSVHRFIADSKRFDN